jgi:broad specificity phosphatase PhoE
VRLILVRHGDAHAGFHGVIGGPNGCTGLTPLGRAQAETLRDHLAVTGRVRADVLLASVLRRAIETASIVAPGLGLDVAAHEWDLCEVHTGEADGLTWTEYADRYGSFNMESEPDRVFAPDGESWNSFHARVQQTLARVSSEYEDQTVVAVCHAGVIMASMRLLLGMSHAGAVAVARLRPANTGLTEWEYEPSVDRWTLHSFNEAGHLLNLTPGTDRAVRVAEVPVSPLEAGGDPDE